MLQLIASYSSGGNVKRRKDDVMRGGNGSKYNTRIEPSCETVEQHSEYTLKRNVYSLMKQDLSDVQIAEKLGLAYTQVKMYRISYEKSHASGN